MNRRKFLGAAAALSTLPAVGGTATATADEAAENSTQPRVDVSNGTGVSHASIESGDPVEGFLHLDGFDEDATRLDVNGYSYDDEPGEVGIRALFGCGDLSLSLSPERAMELAEELTVAAEHAWRDGE